MASARHAPDMRRLAALTVVGSFCLPTVFLDAFMGCSPPSILVAEPVRPAEGSYSPVSMYTGTQGLGWVPPFDPGDAPPVAVGARRGARVTGSRKGRAADC